MTTRIFIGLIVFMVTTALVAVIGLGESERMETYDKAYLARSIESGASLFEGNCAGCHGIQGQGISGVAPALNDYYFFSNRLKEVGYSGSLHSFIAGAIAAGRPVKTADWSQVMPTWGQTYDGPLRGDQIEDLVNYILNWEAAAVAVGPPPTPEPVTDEPVERGKAVYLGAGGCGGCHTIAGLEGAVGQVGPELTNITTVAAGRVEGQTAEDYIHTAIINPEAYLAQECPLGPCADIMPKDLGTRLAQQEIDDLITYLLTLE